MPGVKGRSGGKREGAGRKPAPSRLYFRFMVEVPALLSPLEEQSLKWYASLSPFDRLGVIKEAFELSANHGQWLREIGTVDENGEWK